VRSSRSPSLSWALGVSWRLDARNTASRAVLERLGMRQEANLIENEWIKGELTSEVDYAVLAREWLKAHG
jgi:RimJ/RimL family protein N-acetyltransferase